MLASPPSQPSSDDGLGHAHHHSGMTGLSTIIATFALRKVLDSSLNTSDEVKVTLYGIRDSGDDPVIGMLYLKRARTHGYIRDMEVGSLFVASSSFHTPFAYGNVSMGVPGEHFYGIAHWIVPIDFPDPHLTFKPTVHVCGRITASDPERRVAQVSVPPKICFNDPDVNSATVAIRNMSLFACRFRAVSRPLVPSDDKMVDVGDCVSFHGFLHKVHMHRKFQGKVRIFEIKPMIHSVTEVQVPPGFELVKQEETQEDE